MSKRILMFGQSGLISYRIKEILQNEIIALGHEQVDFSFNDQIENTLNKYQPDIIINASAYTAVDKAEDEVDLSNQINGYAVGVIANWAKSNQAHVIHFSTDYVFSGENVENKPYRPNDPPHPINQYGKSKLLGEWLLIESGCKFSLFRISWIFDRERGKNFYLTIKKLLTEKNEIKVVCDQYGMPTEAKWVAAEIVKRIKSNPLEQGIFHLAPPGIKTWFDFASEIKIEIGSSCQIIPVSSDEYVTKAKRPKWSVLVENA